MQKRDYKKIDLFFTILPNFILSLGLIVAPFIFVQLILSQISSRYDYYTNTVVKNEIPAEILIFICMIVLVYSFIITVFVGNYILSSIKDTFTLKWITLRGKLKKDVVSEIGIRHSQNVPYIVIQNTYLKVDLETFNELKEGELCEVDCFLYSKKVIYLKS